MPLTFTEPMFVVRNVTDSTITILGVINMVPLEEVDLFALTDIVSKTTILNELRPPLGKLYIDINVRKRLQIIDLQFFSLSSLGLTQRGDLVTHDGGSVFTLEAGPDGYILTSDSSAPSGLSWQPGDGYISDTDIDIGDSVGAGTAGSVLFVGAGSTLAQDNANFYWDDSNNRLAIGNSAPLSKVHISSHDSGAASTAKVALDYYNETSSDVHGPQLQIRRARGTLALPTTLTSTDEMLGALEFYGYDGYAWISPVSITAQHGTDTVSTSNMGGRVRFDVGVAAGLSYEAFRLERNGTNLQTVFNGGAQNNTHTLTIMGNGNASSLVMNDGADNSSRFGFNKVPVTDGYGVHYIDVSGSASLNNTAIISVENTYDGTASAAGIMAFGAGTGARFAGFKIYAPSHADALLASKTLIDSNAPNGILIRSTGEVDGIVEFAYNTTTITHSIGDSSVIFNQNADDIDFNVQGDSRPNLLLVDGYLGRVGINRASGAHTATLDIDNLAVAEAVFTARDNGTAVFSILAGGALEVAEITAPATPSSGYGRVYVKSDGRIYFLNDAGTEYDLTSAVSDGYDGYITGDGYVGAIAFWSSTSNLANDSTNLYWDSINNRLGLGTGLPNSTLDVRGLIIVDDGYSTAEYHADRVLFQSLVTASFIWPYYGDMSLNVRDTQIYSSIISADIVNETCAIISGTSIATFPSIAPGSDVGLARAGRSELLLNSGGAGAINLIYSQTGSALAMVHGSTENLRLTSVALYTNYQHQGIDFVARGDVDHDNLLVVDAVLNRVGINRASGSHAATLDVDNLNEAENPFLVRDDGYEVFSVLDGGGIQLSAIAQPLDPPVGYGKIYPKSNGHLYFLNDDGTEYNLTAGDGYGDGYISGTGDSGAVTFWDGYTTISGDGDNLFWNNTLKRLGIGTASPATALDVRGVISAATGTPSNPSYTFVNDTDTGVLRSSENVLAVSAGNVEVLRVDGYGIQLYESANSPPPSPGFGRIYAKTDGRLYFHDDGSTEYDLTQPTSDVSLDGYVSGSGSTGAVTIWDGYSTVTADGYNFVWNNITKALGIGTDNPDASLHIESNTNAANQTLRIVNNSAGANAAASVNLANNSGALLNIRHYGDGYSGSLPDSAGSAVLSINGTGTSSGKLDLLSTMPSGSTASFGFWTNDSSSGYSNAERVRIKSAELVVNDSALDYDFRVEGYGSRANLLLVDGYTGRVGINRPAGSHGSTLDIDNLAVSESPLIIRDNGTEIFSVMDGGGVQLREQSAPGIPNSGYGRLYAKTDGKIYFQDDIGTEYDLTLSGGGGGGGTPRQEFITTETITGTDTELSDTLNYAPVSSASITLFLNGVFQMQGDGYDYTASGSIITWRAGTGTAVDMSTTDRLVAVYQSTS